MEIHPSLFFSYKSGLFLLALLFLSTTATIAATIQLPETGQTKCYDTWGTEIPCSGTGQDGEIRKGLPWPEPRFTITYCDAFGPCASQEFDCDGNTSNDIVTDNLTGLTFSRNGNLAGAEMPWGQALNYTSTLNSSGGICGYTDWRLPNRNELTSIIDRSQKNPAIPLNHPFTNVNSNYYWSSSTDDGSSREWC
jgi:hypothetical protein